MQECEFEEVPVSKLNHAIDEWIHSERDRIILKKRLIDGYTFQQISDYLYKLDKTQLTAKTIGRKLSPLEAKLFKHI